MRRRKRPSPSAPIKPAINASIYNLLDKNFAKAKVYDNNGTPTYATDYSHSGRSTTGTLEERRRLWLSATYEF